MVDREVEGQHVFSLICIFDIFDRWSIVKLTGLCVRSRAALGAYVGGVGRSWGLYGRSRARKCEEHGYLENMLISRAGARSAAWGSVLSCSWGLCCRSWAALGTYVDGLVPLLGPMFAILGPLLAVLGRSWGLCWRSWAALGTYVGGLGPLLGPALAVLGCSWGLCSGKMPRT